MKLSDAISKNGIVYENPTHWESQFSSLLQEGRPKVTHLIGIGNSMKEDDAVGLFIVSRLRKRLGAHPIKSVRIHAPSLSPESALSSIDRRTERVVIIDAVEAGIEPGQVVLTNLANTRFGYFATHNIPLKLVPNVSENLLNIFVLGIQPENVDIGEGLSEDVLESANDVVEKITRILGST